jgi:hypothetical protein
MHVLVAMRMVMTVTMIVAVCVPMVKSHDANEIDSKTGNTDNEEFLYTSHLAARGQSLHCLVYNLQTDDHQKHSIGEPRQCVNFAIAVWKAYAGRPSTHDCS